MDPQSGVPLALGLKFVLLILLPSEGPHHPHGGEVLLSAGGHLALGLVGSLEPGGNLPVEYPRRQAHNGDKGQSDQGQFHVHAEHDPQIQDDEEHRPHHLHQLVAHEGADHVHIGGAALDDVAGGMLLVPRKGQILDAPVQVIPQPLDVGLGPAGQLRPLPEAAQAPQQRRHHDGSRRPPQRRDRLLPQRLQRQYPQHQRRQLGLLGSQDGVHRDTDDLGRQGVERHGQARTQQRRRKMPPAGAQIVPDEPGLLPPRQLECRSILFHKPPSLSRRPADRLSKRRRHPAAYKKCAPGWGRTQSTVTSAPLSGRSGGAHNDPLTGQLALRHGVRLLSFIVSTV